MASSTSSSFTHSRASRTRRLTHFACPPARREVVEGMGGCPQQWDPVEQRVRNADVCPRRSGVFPNTTCDPATPPWCRQEGVVSPRRAEGGPIILTYTGGCVGWGLARARGGCV